MIVMISVAGAVMFDKQDEELAKKGINER